MRRHSEPLIAGALMLALLAALALIWFPFNPNTSGKVSADFSLWLPDMLAGYFWYLRNGLFAVPWFSPAQCAGIPFHADPQVAWFSVPQFLTFVMPPLAAAKTTFLLFAAAGFWGAWHLARRIFALSLPASLFAASLFMLNGFFGVRMVVGHLTYAPFMLLPALAACVLRPPASAPCGWPEAVLRSLVGGLIVGLSIQAGMVHILPPAYLSLLMVMVIHGWRCGPQWPALWRLVAASVVGVALSAGKLAAALALLSNFPRETYPLPGVAGLPTLLYVIFRCLFTPVSDAMGHLVTHSVLIQEQHEFEFGVSAAPLLLMLAAAWQAFRQGWRPAFGWAAAALLALLLVPVALNLYVPWWNAVLKSLPFFGSSSTLLRWCCAYILPAILGGALALDSLAGRNVAYARLLAAGGIALMLGTTAFSDHTKYGPAMLGMYDEKPIEAAWQRAHDLGTIPPISDVTTLRDEHNALAMAPERQNGLVQGYSTLFCYEPLFGYRLERFPFGKIRIGPTLEPRDGLLNLKNPACYVFPGANQCHPGDQFAESRIDDATNFITYRPFPFAKPGFAVAADWLNLLALGLVPAGLAWAGWQARAARRKMVISPHSTDCIP